MPTLALNRTASVTLDGTGAGTAELGPSIPGERWDLTGVSVVCSANVSSGQCEAQVYIGPAAAQSWFVDGTFSGDSGDTTNAVTGRPIYPGSYVWVTWSGGPAGAIATMSVTGTRQVP